ncbi:hypothetical protein [Entomomonas asaccharolytica]|uniref:Uncharacterized protein n=1 Tax=Entomomonas asaccharolytica TaxID=2785331 RepID=A0A974RWA7_9GAMM|nr:hypothetical protein [Entomomonas asaccharolytica]QQP84993.1 hypothetical protein JHT90_11425 [Entomomonas asaccharolytica]
MLKKIEDIEKALKAKAYLSALALALTLPDICGKVAYPKLKVGERYIKWFDEHVTDDSPNEIANYPILDGKKCYKLRCAFLHEGSINGIPDVDKFELCINGYSSFGIITSSFGENEENLLHSIKLEISQVCLWIYSSAKVFYDKHEDKSVFEDQNITIIDIDAEANKIQRNE